MSYFIGAVVVLLLVYILIYNRLISFRQKAREAWSGIDVQLKRRYDLIPRLIDVVKAYAIHEQSLFESVTQMRFQALSSNSNSPQALGKAEYKLSGELHSIFAVAENYPNLRANENYLKLQRELAETEDQISASRNIYNSNVGAFNNKIESFPQNVVAGIQGFKKMEFFKNEA